MHVVIVGNGVAGNTVSSVIRESSTDTKITMLSQEEFLEYSACVLPLYMSGEIERKRVFLKSYDCYFKEKINLICGQKVTGIDTVHKKVFWQTGSTTYDKLVLATGSQSVVPLIEGVAKKGVFTLKSVRDADDICGYNGREVAIIGSGPVGVGISIAMRKRGYQVYLIESLECILPAMFDEKPSRYLSLILEDHGIRVLTGERVTAILGNSRVTSIVTNKRQLTCDSVILAVGMKPNVELANKADIQLGELGGVKTNSKMMTNVNDIYACGDCAETEDMVTGKPCLSFLWHCAKHEAIVAGYNCLGDNKEYPGSLNIVGLDIFGIHACSVGSVSTSLKPDKLQIIEKAGDNYYYRLLLADDTLVGAQLIGKTKDMGILLTLLRKCCHISQVKEHLTENVAKRQKLGNIQLMPFLRYYF